MNKDERILRENIQQLIRHVKQKRLNEEQEIRNSLKKIMGLELKKMLSEVGTPDVDPAPNKSTGINVLEELLKKIIPVLETDFKSLTTSEEQRQSFRAHIRSDAEKKAEEEEEEPDDPREEFGAGVEGDETGRNMAYNSFKKVESTIIDSYELLSAPEDQELFYDYLIANLKLYFDKFEGELTTAVEEPTNQAYDMAKEEEPAAAEEGGEDLGFGVEDEDLELEL